MPDPFSPAEPDTRAEPVPHLNGNGVALGGPSPERAEAGEAQASPGGPGQALDELPPIGSWPGDEHTGPPDGDDSGDRPTAGSRDPGEGGNDGDERAGPGEADPDDQPEAGVDEKHDAGDAGPDEAAAADASPDPQADGVPGAASPEAAEAEAGGNAADEASAAPAEAADTDTDTEDEAAAAARAADTAGDEAADAEAGTDDHGNRDAQKLYGRWYYASYSVPYEHGDHWKGFFGGLAERIVAELAPTTTLDAGCAKGFLVAALRERGVEAEGFDLSEVAVADAPEIARPHVRVGSLTEPIEGRYDLVTCIEVIEHLDPADTAVAVANLCRASDKVLLSSTPGDLDEPTHVNIQPPERWSQLFALHGFYRDFHHDAGYISPWAALYRKGEPTVAELVLDYDRAWSQLRAETLEQRRALLDMQDRFEHLRTKGPEEFERLHAVLEDLNREILRLRDSVIGKEAELATTKGRIAELEAGMARYAELEERLDAVLSSNSWKVMWAAGLPVRLLRERKGQ